MERFPLHSTGKAIDYASGNPELGFPLHSTGKAAVMPHLWPMCGVPPRSTGKIARPACRQAEPNGFNCPRRGCRAGKQEFLTVRGRLSGLAPTNTFWRLLPTARGTCGFPRLSAGGFHNGGIAGYPSRTSGKKTSAACRGTTLGKRGLSPACQGCWALTS